MLPHRRLNHILALRHLSITAHFEDAINRNDLIRVAKTQYTLLGIWRGLGDRILSSKPTQADVVAVLYAFLYLTPTIAELVHQKHVQNGINHDRYKDDENVIWCEASSWHIVETYWAEISAN